MDDKMKRTWAEVSLDNLAHNYTALRDLIPADCRFMGMVKANAYGHGAVPIAQKLEELGADYFGVACLDEALTLRKAGIKTPILILGVTPPQYAKELVENELTQTVSDLEMARELHKEVLEAYGTLKIHIKLDTGMTRLGFLCDDGHRQETVESILEICNMVGFLAEGIFTHFADSDGDETYTMMQFERFLTVIKELEDRGETFKIRHCANSAATILYPFSHLDMVRPGIALYGHYPDPNMDEELCPLLPVMEVKTRVAAVREIPEGTPVSYGRTHTLLRNTRLAVLPIGYGDGFCRGFSDTITVLIRGQKAKVVGRICMDMCMVDVTDLPEVQEGDVVTVYGADEGDTQSVEASAEILNTISYELLCILNNRIPRVYLGLPEPEPEPEETAEEKRIRFHNWLVYGIE